MRTSLHRLFFFFFKKKKKKKKKCCLLILFYTHVKSYDIGNGFLDVDMPEDALPRFRHERGMC